MDQLTMSMDSIRFQSKLYTALHKIDIKQVSCICNLAENLVAFGKANGFIQIWSSTTKDIIHVINAGSFVTSMTFMMGKYLVSCGSNNVINIWNLNTNKLERQINTILETVIDLQSFDNKLLVHCTDAKLYIISINILEMSTFLNTHQDWLSIEKVLIGKRNIYAVILCSDYEYYLWNLTTSRCMHVLDNVTNETKYGLLENNILMSNNKYIYYYDLESNKLVRIIKNDSDISSFIVLKDDLVVVGLETGEVVIWENTEIIQKLYRKNELINDITEVDGGLMVAGDKMFMWEK